MNIRSSKWKRSKTPIWEAIGGGINSFNEEQAGAENAKRICFVVYNAEGKIVGGVIALTYWDWLYIDLMWLRSDIRRKGYGRRLLVLTEDDVQTASEKALMVAHKMALAVIIESFGNLTLEPLKALFAEAQEAYKELADI